MKKEIKKETQPIPLIENIQYNEQSRMQHEINLRIIQELSMLLRNESIYGSNVYYNVLKLNEDQVYNIQDKLMEYVNKL